jgi:RimJ/RimL family protein N-acetyltransferase
MRPIGIRPLEADDTEELRSLFSRLSPDTIYLRFFQPIRQPSDAVFHHLAAVDHEAREALAAVVGDRIVGIARYDRNREDPTKAEVAILVEDEWQGQRVGTLLLSRLTERALERGITTFTASVLGENRRMLALARRLAPDRRIWLEHGEWELEIPLLAG